MASASEMTLWSTGAEEAPRQERAETAFKQLRQHMTGQLRTELESALTEAVREYSPTDRENRFVVGGAVEHIIAAAMRAVGVPVGTLGHAGIGADIAVYVKAVRDELLSLKATFSASSSYEFRLVNFLGTAMAREMHPTLFLIPGLGIVLAHQGHATITDAIQVKSDAMTLKSRAIHEHAQLHPELLIEIDVPVNDGVVRRVASIEVAKAILSRPHYPLLGAAVADHADPVLERVDLLTKMVALHESGELDDGEFARAKHMLLGD